jgi:hypothetical protein
MNVLVLALLTALLAPADLTGVWRMVYEPTAEGRKHVYEPSTGYLVFLANGTYVEFRHDCCDGPSLPDQPLPYRIEGNEVVLTRVRRDGTKYESRLTYRKSAKAAVLEGKNTWLVIEAPALALKDSLNYGWAKIYP